MPKPVDLAFRIVEHHGGRRDGRTRGRQVYRRLAALERHAQRLEERSRVGAGLLGFRGRRKLRRVCAGVPFFPGPDASAWTSASFEIDNTDVNACIAARSSQWTSALTASIDGCSDEIRSPCSCSDRAIPARYPLFVRMMTFCVVHPSLTDCVSASSSFEGVSLSQGRDRGSYREGGKETENGEFHTLTSRAIVPPAFASDGEH